MLNNYWYNRSILGYNNIGQNLRPCYQNIDLQICLLEYLVIFVLYHFYHHLQLFENHNQLHKTHDRCLPEHQTALKDNPEYGNTEHNLHMSELSNQHTMAWL